MKRFKTDSWLKIAYLTAGVYDIVLGVGLVFLAKPFSLISGVSLPDSLIFVQVSGLFLITMGYFLIYSCRNPKNFVFVGVGSAFVRFSYVMIIILALLVGTIESAFVFLAATDGLTGLFILLVLVLTEGISWRKVW
ncbi:MAG: hypothetical protein ACFFD4_23645 [Candidatus Odinarchaeota archaeon]